MRIDFEMVSSLQYRNRALSKQVENFKSGEQYVRMEAENKRLVRFHNQEMNHYRNSLSAESKPDAKKMEEFKRRYREILQKAKEEHEYIR